MSKKTEAIASGAAAVAGGTAMAVTDGRPGMVAAVGTGLAIGHAVTTVRDMRSGKDTGDAKKN
ncbi:hypothetical protein GCM10023195_61400 [Actinoallomurus liliacearum]|uniref:Glycine zipper domain-containing protein n=1 Tax=Actinoallomurus liliacearum TaxID=1080073 RepID=A0ABP8TSP8_9ACTN